MRWWPTGDEQLGQCCQHILAAKSPRNRQGQALPAGFIDDRQNTELATVVRAPLDDCLLSTSDAADERSRVDLGGRRIIKKKQRKQTKKKNNSKAIETKGGR